MQATRALRQAAHAAERVPLIRFVGKHQAPGQLCLPTCPFSSVTRKLTRLSPLQPRLTTARNHTQPPQPVLSPRVSARVPAVTPTAPSAATVTRHSSTARCARASARSEVLQDSSWDPSMLPRVNSSTEASCLPDSDAHPSTSSRSRRLRLVVQPCLVEGIVR